MYLLAPGGPGLPMCGRDAGAPVPRTHAGLGCAPRPPASRALCQAKRAPRAAFPSGCLAAQTKRWPLRPLRGLQETRVATREESGVLGFPTRRPSPHEMRAFFCCMAWRAILSPLSMKGETVPDSLPATPKIPPTRRQFHTWAALGPQVLEGT